MTDARADRLHRGRCRSIGALVAALLISAACGGSDAEPQLTEPPSPVASSTGTATVTDVLDVQVDGLSEPTEDDRWQRLEAALDEFSTIERRGDHVRRVPCVELVLADGAMSDPADPAPRVAGVDEVVRWVELETLSLTDVTPSGVPSIDVGGAEMLAPGSVLLALHQLEGSGATFVVGIVPEPDRVRHLVVRTAEGELVYADTCESMMLSEQLLIDLGASLGPTATASQVLGSVIGVGPSVPGADLEALATLSRQDPFVPALEDSEGGGLDEENFDDEQQAALTEAILEVGIPEQWRTSDATICTGSIWGSNECAVLDLEEEYRVFDGHLPLLVLVARDEPTEIRITIAGRFVGATVVDPANPVDPVGQPRAATARVRIDTDLTIEEFLGGADGRIELIAS